MRDWLRGVKIRSRRVQCLTGVEIWVNTGK